MVDRMNNNSKLEQHICDLAQGAVFDLQQGYAAEYIARRSEFERQAMEDRERLQRAEKVVKELEGKAAELLLTQQQLAAVTAQRQSDLDAHQRDRLRMEVLDSELQQCQSAQDKDRVHADAIVSELRTQVAEGQEQK